MRTRQNAFGRACFLLGLAALYILAGMKLYLAWRDDLWPNWPLGDYLPDAVVRAVFTIREPTLRSGLVWLLSQDVVAWAAGVCLVLWGLALSGNAGGGGDDTKKPVSR